MLKRQFNLKSILFLRKDAKSYNGWLEFYSISRSVSVRFSSKKIRSNETFFTFLQLTTTRLNIFNLRVQIYEKTLNCLAVAYTGRSDSLTITSPIVDTNIN